MYNVAAAAIVIDLKSCALEYVCKQALNLQCFFTGAMTFAIMALSIMALSITKITIVTLSIVVKNNTLRINNAQPNYILNVTFITVTLSVAFYRCTE